MSKADEMFRELGYKKSKRSNNCVTEYQKNRNGVNIWVNKLSKSIQKSGNTNLSFTFEEIKACCQMVKELEGANGKA